MWWHLYGSDDYYGAVVNAIIGPTLVGPDDDDPVLGRVKDPLISDEGAQIMDYVTSFDHEPSEDEKLSAMAEKFESINKDDLCKVYSTDIREAHE